MDGRLKNKRPWSFFKFPVLFALRFAHCALSPALREFVKKIPSNCGSRMAEA
jgi:hypothetical protein